MKHVHGGDIYSHKYELDFSANINPLGMPESVKAAALAGVEESEAYPDPQHTSLRLAIAQRDEVDPGQVICGNGAAELIFMLCDALAPRRALLIQPGFAEYELALTKVGCEIEFYACDPADAFLVREDYLEHLREDVDLAFLCNPNNPTGVLLEEGFLDQVIEKCRENRIMLVLDECFVGLTEAGEAISKKNWIGRSEFLVILRAFTKLYAMPGLRLGYALSANEGLLEKMRETVQPWSVSVPAQMAGIAALKEKEYEAKSRTYITREREYLAAALQALGLRIFKPAANFIFFVGPAKLGERCAGRGILLRDCSNYRGLAKGYWRVAVRTREENRRLVEVLQDVMAPVESGM